MSIATDIYHLQELPRYASEKPYTMRYVPEGAVAVSNVEREKHLVSVKDIRSDIAEREYSLDKNGFTICHLDTQMQYEDYDDHDKITNVYLPELESKLQSYFPGSSVDFVSYLVSVRQKLRIQTFLTL